ncbi:hypothetical protein [Roseateles sp. P5_E7]
MKGWTSFAQLSSFHSAAKDLIEQRKVHLSDIGIAPEFFDLPQLRQISILEGVPLLDLSRSRHVELPMNSNTLFPAKRAMEVRHIPIFALQLPALQAGKRTVAHDVQRSRQGAFRKKSP